MEVDYSFKLGEDRYVDNVRVDPGKLVKHLRNAIWEKYERTFLKLSGIGGPAFLELWKKEGKEALNLNRILTGEEKEVFVTPVRATTWDAAFVLSGTPLALASAEASTSTLAEFTNEFKTAMSRMTTVMEMFLKIQMEEWKDDTPSRSGDGGGFKRLLIQAYGDSDEKHDLMCMATGIRLPYEYVTAGHILGKKLRAKARVTLNVDVNDAQNGVLWCTPVEQAWTYNKICFSWSVIDNTYILLLLDDGLQNTELAWYAEGLISSARNALGKLTFGQLHGKKMDFLNDFRPYKRSFLLMSSLKKQWAAEEGWKAMFSDGDAYDFEYWSAGSYKDRVVAWLKAQDPVDLKKPEVASLESGNSSQPEVE